MTQPDEPDQEVPDGAAVLPLIPAELGVQPLLLAVLHAVVFLDGSDQDVVDPDAAAEALEYIATYLQRLPKPQLDRLREDLDTLRGFGKQQGWSKEQLRFLKGFLESFGVDSKS